MVEEIEKKYGHLFVPSIGKRKVKPEILKERQSLPLSVKVYFTCKRIKVFYERNDGKVYVAYSGGKDSEVLRTLAKRIFPDIPAVFVDTKMEIETRQHARKKADVVVSPKKRSTEIWGKYGLPFPSKTQSHFLYQARTTNSEKLRSRLMTGYMADGRKTMFSIADRWKPLLETDFKFSDHCCYYLKKEPFKRYEKQTGRKPILGTMANESMQRKQIYLRDGCIKPGNDICTPLGFWTEQDILQFLISENIDYCKSAYGEIIQVDKSLFGDYTLKTEKANRTGCYMCLYGIQYDDSPNRVQRMKEDRPKLWEFMVKKFKIDKLLSMCDIPH